MLGDIPEAWVVQDGQAVVPVFGAPEVDLAHTGGFTVGYTFFETASVKRLVLLGQAGLGYSLTVWRPGFGLELA